LGNGGSDYGSCGGVCGDFREVATMIANKIKEIQDDFIQLITNGEYYIKSAEEHKVVISVVGYEFTIWTANGIDCIQHYTSYDDKSPVKLPRFNRELQRSLWRKIKPKIAEESVPDIDEEIRRLQRLKATYMKEAA